MKATKVNGAEVYLKDLGAEITEEQKSLITSINSAFDTTKFKYFTAEQVKSQLGIHGVDLDLLIDFEDYIVISEKGKTIDGTTYYILEDTKNRVESDTSKNIGNLDFSYNIEPYGVDRYKVIIDSTTVGDVNSITVKYKKNNWNYWNIADNNEFIVDQLTDYDIICTDANNNEVKRRISLSDIILPSEYQKVEYIENTGASYIDTGIIGKTGVSADIIMMRSKSDINDTCFLGSRNGNNRIYLLHSYNGWMYGYGAYYNGGNFSTEVKQTVHTELNLGKQELRVNENALLTGKLTDSYDTRLTMWMFAMNYNGQARYPMKAKCYSCKIYENGNIVRNFIPCYRKSDDVIGLYDIVEGKFYTNSGTGTFLKGNDV